MEALQKLNNIYQALVQAEVRLQDAERELQDAQLHYTRLTEDLGDLLHAHGMSEIKMNDGKTVGLKAIYFASFSQERMEAIRTFLALQGSEDMLKPKKLKIDAEIIDILPVPLRENVEYEIHPQTLKAFVTELANDGKLTEEARELFKVHQVNKVVIR